MSVYGSENSADWGIDYFVLNDKELQPGEEVIEFNPESICGARIESIDDKTSSRMLFAIQCRRNAKHPEKTTELFEKNWHNKNPVVPADLEMNPEVNFKRCILNCPKHGYHSQTVDLRKHAIGSYIPCSLCEDEEIERVFSSRCKRYMNRLALAAEEAKKNKRGKNTNGK